MNKRVKEARGKREGRIREGRKLYITFALRCSSLLNFFTEEMCCHANTNPENDEKEQA